jgi:hypothetical protein
MNEMLVTISFLLMKVTSFNLVLSYFINICVCNALQMIKCFSIKVLTNKYGIDLILEAQLFSLNEFVKIKERRHMPSK